MYVINMTNCPWSLCSVAYIKVMPIAVFLKGDRAFSLLPQVSEGRK